MHCMFWTPGERKVSLLSELTQGQRRDDKQRSRATRSSSDWHHEALDLDVSVPSHPTVTKLMPSPVIRSWDFEREERSQSGRGEGMLFLRLIQAFFQPAAVSVEMVETGRRSRVTSGQLEEEGIARGKRRKGKKLRPANTAVSHDSGLNFSGMPGRRRRERRRGVVGRSKEVLFDAHFGLISPPKGVSSSTGQSETDIGELSLALPSKSGSGKEERGRGTSGMLFQSGEATGVAFLSPRPVGR
uniref:Uncharacterized protein n=1 Tax=Chromera velia CCMP2878 TaxID=1169474 RepID=A0A0G4FBF5_9ALVE|eukprot:Cvel_3051.t1-p1 / transcript=Cvel_3051.t1 / gene=Cvel_3051 / organism=Chromera_velia_CCMP2878 / gene_product=hypothetical protein / transcript_product=hypothetical protein / location=Cvel_scaffold122:6680-7492(+) / protein_length=242 / sequence_SO=supercontig / SO=protein_coding / is_pseudo=false